jgi:hypothetical protein
MVTIGKESQSRVDWLLMLAIAGLLGVSTRMQIGAREAARSMRL